jgi:hypothetical protein
VSARNEKTCKALYIKAQGLGVEGVEGVEGGKWRVR